MRKAPTMKIHVHSKTGAFLGSVAGLFLSAFGKSHRGPTVEDFKRLDFKTSTQRVGVRFGEKIRDVFRFKWLRRNQRA